MKSLFPSDTDAVWQQFGRSDPYYGVLADDRFSAERISESALREFYATGAEHVETLIQQIRMSLVPGFAPDTALDFGCGTGRIAIPMAEQGMLVTAVDVSPAMLERCGGEAAKRGLRNVRLLTGRDFVSSIETYDWVHTYIVLQHIAVRRGLKIIDQLCQRVKPGGVGTIHITVRRSVSSTRRIAGLLVERLPLLSLVSNAFERKPLWRPKAQMNMYDLHNVISRLQPYAGDRFVLVPTKHFTSEGYIVMFDRRE
jgi:2-polyprenyl-3-methyl-5-hydroxy-6-metoxy-1,4-benzoquinol methylase